MKISDPQQIRISDYNYNLPDERIAKYPLDKRDSSKLLVYKHQKIEEAVFSSISDYIPTNSLLIYNNTKVIQARLHFNKSTGAAIEIFCLDPYSPRDYSLVFQQTRKCSWICLIGNSRRWKEGELTKQLCIDGVEVCLKACRLQTLTDGHVIEFEWDNSNFTFSDLLEAAGELPIPPYLNRETEQEDHETYQTVYSKIKGSVAAPTAGLHFTPDVLADMARKGIQTDEVTLHVGAGTFKPVSAEMIKDHLMHSEFISVSKQTIQNLLQHTGKVIAVGTTSVRTLESLYYIGSLLETESQPTMLVTQWMPYEEQMNSLSVQKALGNILAYLDANSLDCLLADTQIMIVPGYQFRIVEGIITNFHQPKSTLLLLVSAFVDGRWTEIYDYALAHDFRFLSYGDSSILLRL